MSSIAKSEERLRDSLFAYSKTKRKIKSVPNSKKQEAV